MGVIMMRTLFLCLLFLALQTVGAPSISSAQSTNEADCVAACLSDNEANVNNCIHATMDSCPDLADVSHPISDDCRLVQMYCIGLERAGNQACSHKCLARFNGGFEIISKEAIAGNGPQFCFLGCYSDYDDEQNCAIAQPTCPAAGTPSGDICRDKGPLAYCTYLEYHENITCGIACATPPTGYTGATIAVAEADIGKDRVQLCMMGCMNNEFHSVNNCNIFMSCPTQGPYVALCAKSKRMYCDEIARGAGHSCSLSCIADHQQ
jgi:hypothetical protein